MADSERSSEVLSLTASIVAAHVSNNPVPLAELPQLIERVYQSLAGPGAEPTGPGARPPPAVPIKKSVTAEYIICLEDGLKLRMLKRHLRTAFNLTPEQYRQRWGLAADYPMVAPNYAKKRSQLARALGLGTKGRRRRS
jgi:predicted transcriptional regulator